MNKKNKIILILLLILVVTLSIFLILYFNLKINLLGKSNETIEVFDKYTEPGYSITLFNKKIKMKVKTNSNLNENKLGSYKIIYKTNFILPITKTRKIKVVDTTKPKINLNGNEFINIYILEDYIDEGITVNDNYDKNIEENVTIENNLNNKSTGSYTINYTAKDSSGNESTITRTINVLEKVIKSKYNKKCTITNSIEKYICENNIDVSVGYYNIKNEKTYYYQNNKLYYGASLIKTLDALYLYDNNLITDELIPYVEKAITVSDNPSHFYLVNHIGKSTLKEYGKSIGAPNTFNGNDNFGSTSVNDQIAYMKKLYEITKDNQQEQLTEFFLNTRKNCLLFENSPKIMHKYGHWTYVYHNSGIVLDENPYIVTILTNEGYSDYQTIIKTLSKLIYEYHKEI